MAGVKPTSERLECVMEDDDGTMRLFINGIELTPKQCEKLVAWLEQTHRVLTGFKGL